MLFQEFLIISLNTNFFDKIGFYFLLEKLETIQIIIIIIPHIYYIST